jgi:hypothetical protein
MIPRLSLQERSCHKEYYHSRFHLNGNWPAHADVLSALRDQPTIFPHLTELRLFYNETVADSKLRETIRDVLLLRKGRITHLTVPPFHGDDGMDFLKKYVPHLEVCCVCFHRHILSIFP